MVLRFELTPALGEFPGNPETLTLPGRSAVGLLLVVVRFTLYKTLAAMRSLPCQADLLLASC
jgi:hypothetical protein